MLLNGLRNKAFLHISDPVLYTAKKMAAQFNSHFTANRTQRRVMTNYKEEQRTCSTGFN